MSETHRFFTELKALAEDFQKLREENAELKAELQRLRKAGDDLYYRIDCGCEICNDARDAWNAAREGKPS